VPEEDAIIGTRYMVAGTLLGTAGMPSADAAGTTIGSTTTGTGTATSGAGTPGRKMK